MNASVTPVVFEIDDTDLLLQYWAAWVHQTPAVKTRFPTLTPFRRLMGGSIKARSPLTDEQAEVIDIAVARMGTRLPELGEIVVEYYLHGRSVRKIALRLKLDRRHIEQRLTAARYWLDARLFGGPLVEDMILG